MKKQPAYNQDKYNSNSTIICYPHTSWLIKYINLKDNENPCVLPPGLESHTKQSFGNLNLTIGNIEWLNI